MWICGMEWVVLQETMVVEMEKKVDRSLDEEGDKIGPKRYW